MVGVEVEKLRSREAFVRHWKTFPRWPMLIKTTLGVEAGDKKGATEILPIEVWDVLLNKLENPEDLYAAHNCCSTFSKLLTKKRSTFLFPSVFPILMDWGLETNFRYSDLRRYRSNQFDKGVLPFRAVSRFWKFGVNAHFQSWEYRLRCIKRDLPDFDLFKFGTQNGIERFMEKMESHTRNDNPFFTGLVEFYDGAFTAPDQVLRFWEAVTSTLLPQFGQHIIYCKVNSRRLSWDASRAYPVLAQVLSQLPALRYLDLRPDMKEHASLTEQVCQTPLPYFQKLKTLEVTNTPVTMINELLRACSKCQLQTFVVHFRDNKKEAFFNASSWDLLNQLSNLEEVSLHTVSSYSSPLVKLSHASWSITRLALTVKLVDEDSQLRKDQISVSRLFQTLSTLGDKGTIRDLELKMDGLGEIGLDLRLNLPSLEHFSMNCYRPGVFVNSLDFAVKMKALKSLKIDTKTRFPAKKNKEEVIKFSGFVENMKASNIWTVFLNLEQLSLKDSCYPTYVYYWPTRPRSLFWHTQRQRELRRFRRC